MPFAFRATPLRNRFAAALCLDFTAGCVELIGLVGLHGLLPVQVVVDAPLAVAALTRGEGGWVARVLAIPTFLLVTALAARAASRSSANLRLITGYLLFFQCLLLLSAMAMGMLLGPFSRPDRPAAVLTGLVLVSAMALQSVGAAALWRERLSLLSTFDLARLAARLGRGLTRGRDITPQLSRLAAFAAGLAVAAVLWPRADFWSLAVPAAGSFASLLAFVPFDFARAAADLRRR